jgi:hypothetical protein
VDPSIASRVKEKKQGQMGEGRTLPRFAFGPHIPLDLTLERHKSFSFQLKFFPGLPMPSVVGVAATRHRHRYENRKFGLIQGGNRGYLSPCSGYTKMNYKEILSHPRPIQPLCLRDFVVQPAEFAVQVTFPCGHQQFVNLTKSAIKRRCSSDVIQRAIDHGCFWCYKVASDAVEAARKQVVKLVCEGQVASIREAVELVTDDTELRVAVYERVGHGRDNPLAMNLADVTTLARRAQAMRAAPQA